MMKQLWLSAGLLVAALALSVTGRMHREAPLWGAQKLVPEIEQLEASVAKAPQSAQLLAQLSDAYLQRGTPGPAVAAIAQAPDPVRSQPVVLHVWARALMRQGKASQALEKERQVIASCAGQECPSGLVTSAQRHEQFLSALLAQGVEDYRKDPQATVLAYRSVQGASIEMLDPMASSSSPSQP